jgi:hypothetical protein
LVVDIFVGLQIVPKANFQPGRALENYAHRLILANNSHDPFWPKWFLKAG